MTNSQSYALPGCRIDHSRIIKVVSDICGVKHELICTKSQKREISECRGMAIYLIRKLLNYSQVQTGIIFPTDHSNVAYWQKKTISLASIDPVHRDRFIKSCRSLGVKSEKINDFLKEK